MEQYECIDMVKSKSGNQIIGYRLRRIDVRSSKIFFKEKEKIKKEMLAGRIYVSGLEIGLDGRLVPTYYKGKRDDNQTSPDIRVSASKLDRLDYEQIVSLQRDQRAVRINTVCGNPCYLLSDSPTNHIVYIPRNVSRLNTSYIQLEFTETLRALRGKLTIIGKYANLYDINNMLSGCNFDIIDLSNLNVKSVVTANHMCAQLRAPIIKLPVFNKLEDVAYMFYNSQIPVVDITGMVNSPLRNMLEMFSGSIVEHIIGLDKLNTSRVTNMAGTFGRCCNLKELDLSHFDVSGVRTMFSMFSNSSIENLDISHFNASCLWTVSHMFCHYHGKNLRLSGISTPFLSDMDNMFYGAKIENLEMAGVSTDKVYDVSTVFHFSKIGLVTDNARLQKSYNLREKTAQTYKSLLISSVGISYQGGMNDILGVLTDHEIADLRAGYTFEDIYRRRCKI